MPTFNKHRGIAAEVIDTDGKVLRDVNSYMLTHAAFSPDGATTVIVPASKPALILEAATGKDKGRDLPASN